MKKLVDKAKQQFLADTNADTLTGPTRLSHWILWLALAFVIVAGLWATFAKLDTITHAQGKVIPSRQVQIVQNLEGGLLRQLLVHEGEIVKQDQVLMYIDDTRFASAYQESQEKVMALMAKMARLEAEASGKPFQPAENLQQQAQDAVAGQIQLFESRQRELKSNLNILSNQYQQRVHELEELQARKEHVGESYRLLRKEIRITQPLVKEGAVSEIELLRLERERSQMEAELSQIKLGIPRTEAMIAEAKNKKEEFEISFRTDALDELSEVKGELARLEQSNKALKDRVARTSVKSPVHGIVSQVYVNTVGGVIQPGEDIVEIVPLDDTLLIEAMVSPADIAFLRPHQDAMVKLTAYDFSVYGGLKAQLEHISADTTKDEEGNSFYEIRLRTQRNHLGSETKPLPIIPGMTATVDILGDKKSVMAYLMKPILKTKQRALREH